MLSSGFVELRLNYNRNLAFIGLEFLSKTLFRSTHIAEEHLFSMFPSILTFGFDPIYRLHLALSYFEGWDQVQKLFWVLLI